MRKTHCLVLGDTYIHTYIHICSLYHAAMVSCFSHVSLCVTPRGQGSADLVQKAPLSMKFSRQEYWSGLPCSPSGDLPDPGMEPMSFMSLALAGGFFTTSTA